MFHRSMIHGGLSGDSVQQHVVGVTGIMNAPDITTTEHKSREMSLEFERTSRREAITKRRKSAPDLSSRKDSSLIVDSRKRFDQRQTATFPAGGNHPVTGTSHDFCCSYTRN